jgi:hypothetical protein
MARESTGEPQRYTGKTARRELSEWEKKEV